MRHGGGPVRPLRHARQLTVDVADMRATHDGHIDALLAQLFDERPHNVGVSPAVHDRGAVPVEDDRVEAPLELHGKRCAAGATPAGANQGRPAAAPGIESRIDDEIVRSDDEIVRSDDRCEGSRLRGNACLAEALPSGLLWGVASEPGMPSVPCLDGTRFAHVGRVSKRPSSGADGPDVQLRR